MPIDCGPVAPTRSWSFDGGEQGFIVQSNGATSTLYWLAEAEGARGVLKADVQPSTEPTWATAIELDGDIGDLRGATVTAAVWVEGEIDAIGVFVQTNGGTTSEHWANGPWTAVSQGTWSCVSLVADAPSFGGPSYDPTAVTRLGVHVEGSGPARVLVDALAH